MLRCLGGVGFMSSRIAERMAVIAASDLDIHSDGALAA
jgi:hypothetical protein